MLVYLFKHGVLTAAALVLVFLTCNPAVGQEPSPKEIAALIKQLGDESNPDKNILVKLKGVRSSKGITKILESLGSVDKPVCKKLCKLLGDIGEPAVEVVFYNSVPRPGAVKPRLPVASHVLTNYLQRNSLPLLEKKLVDGVKEERKVAAWALWSATRHGGTGNRDPDKLIALLLKSALNDDELYVKQYTAQSLSRIKNDAAIPALVKLLSSDSMSDLTVARHVVCGLSRHGAKAGKAIPILKREIRKGNLPPEAFDALINIEGEKSLPFVVETLSKKDYDANDRSMISIALVEHPNPAAIAFMKEELWNGESSSRVRAALFFSKLNHPESLKQLRKCLSVLPKEAESSHPSNTRVSTAANMRSIAVRFLGEQRDAESYATILGMLKNDDSFRVRSAAAESLGKVRYIKAVPALHACFALTDRGRGSSGHSDGTLYRTAVEALGKIATDDAYRFLYQECDGGKAKRQCETFWRDTKDPIVFDKFVELFKKSPLESPTYVGIITSQLVIHRDRYAVDEKDIPEAKKQFLATVDDPEHFPKKAAKQNAPDVEKTFQFYKNGFTVVSFKTKSKNHPIGDRYESMLYQKRGDSTVLVGQNSLPLF